MTKWGEKNGIEFWTMPPERAEEATDVLRNGFFEDEAFCNYSGIPEDDEGQRELSNLAVICAEDGICTMAIEKQTGKIVGVSYNKIQVTPSPGQKGFFEEFRDSKCKSKTARVLINEMIWVGTHITAPCPTCELAECRCGLGSVTVRPHMSVCSPNRTVPVKIQTPHISDGAGTVRPRRSGVGADMCGLVGWKLRCNSFTV
ncbi:hypothetical protein J6590_071590 [Homalodisca vitripennis]|nr:hypothetical protein J6590_071590 [Homalodisca vitripennis]